MEDKTKIIEAIIEGTGVEGEKYFDKLYEKETTYLNKLLKVIKLFKK
jgi:hypothetical protein